MTRGLAHGALLLALALLPLGTPAAAQPAGGTIRVDVVGLRHRRGQLGCNLYDAPPGFPSDPRRALQSRWVPFAAGDRCVFRGVAAGTYAVGVLHDEDGNSRMNANLFGAPQEGWAVTRDAPARPFGPPLFSAASFPFNGREVRLTVRMHY